MLSMSLLEGFEASVSSAWLTAMKRTP